MSTPSLRYTSLRLMALHPADREWVLQRLPATEATALRALLAHSGIGRWTRVAQDIEPPRRPRPARVAAPRQIPTDDLDRIDPTWASLWLRAAQGDAMEQYLVHAAPTRAARVAAAAEQIGPRLPAKLADALNRWVPELESKS